jgi:O-antigen/teichoic acid export membrane protein
VGDEHFAGNMENLMILIIAIQVVFFQLDSSILNGTKDMKRKVWLSAVASALSIALSFLLIPKFQVIGLCISTISGRLVYSIGFPLLLKQKMRDRLTVFDGSKIRMFVAGISLFFISAYLGHIILWKSWFQLVFAGFTSLLVSMLLFWFIGMSKEARALSLKAFSGIRWLKMN